MFQAAIANCWWHHDSHWLCITYKFFLQLGIVHWSICCFLKNQNYFSYSGVNKGNQFIKNTLSFFYSELNSLTFVLETFFNRSIKLELNRLEDPYTDSNIMAQIIGINGKNYTFEKIKKIFFPKYIYLNPKRKINFKKKFIINLNLINLSIIL